MENRNYQRPNTYAKSEEIEKEFSLYAKKVLKSEMGRNLVKIPDLAQKLDINANALGNKINRAKFSVGFFFRALHELGTKEISVPPKEINKE